MSQFQKLSSLRQMLGPGFIVAATGVGAGDLIAAAVAGQRFGLAVLWVVLLGAFFKAILNEGVSRWQLATGTTLMEGWIRHLPRWVSWYFLVYLCFWGFLVAAALISACGVAAHALFPVLPVPVWAALHTSVGAALVWRGGYAIFERVMKGLIAAMFVVVI
ncbi:MAG: Nramp family divalent metal transporter, partial [Verrucomicrobiia bacterium]